MMKIYVNWEWKAIVKTEAEAKDFMVTYGFCDNFNEYLINEFNFPIEKIFNLSEDEKTRFYKEYAKYLDETVKDCWKIVEI